MHTYIPERDIGHFYGAEHGPRLGGVVAKIVWGLLHTIVIVIIITTIIIVSICIAINMAIGVEMIIIIIVSTCPIVEYDFIRSTETI